MCLRKVDSHLAGLHNHPVVDSVRCRCRRSYTAIEKVEVGVHGDSQHEARHEHDSYWCTQVL